MTLKKTLKFQLIIKFLLVALLTPMAGVSYAGILSKCAELSSKLLSNTQGRQTGPSRKKSEVMKIPEGDTFEKTTQNYRGKNYEVIVPKGKSTLDLTKMFGGDDQVFLGIA